MRKWQKRMLRNEYRKNHRVAPKREIGRTPNWVYLERWNHLRSLGAEMELIEE